MFEYIKSLFKPKRYFEVCGDSVVLYFDAARFIALPLYALRFPPIWSCMAGMDYEWEFTTSETTSRSWTVTMNHKESRLFLQFFFSTRKALGLHSFKPEANVISIPHARINKKILYIDNLLQHRR